MLIKSILTILTCIYAVVLIRCLSSLPSHASFGIGIALLAGLVGFCAGDPGLKSVIKGVISAAREDPAQATGLMAFVCFLGYFFWMIYAVLLLGLLAFVLAMWTLVGFDFVAMAVRRRL